ncbi:MAG TPA: ferritin [Candidatus Kapabacteria bacterium]|jgi:ferritin|nr:ferritin [Candidatus Kapabacteria bacterium]HOV92200.1 ferritin [Candidatus Kapabacteria bacterium]
MLLKQEIQEALNTQIIREMYSSNLYLSMAAYYSSINLNGFSHWMRLQAQEELVHSLKIFDFVLDRGGKVKIDQIPAPPSSWDNPIMPFEDSYKHEQLVSSYINEIQDLAFSMKDFATVSFLNWFANEQVEEEKDTNDILDRLHLAGDSKASLFLMDRELGTRQASQGE